MKTQILLIALVCVASSTNIMDIFSEVANDEYGKTLVANIQLQLESGANVDVLTDMMRGVDRDLKQQLADGEAVHDVQREACGNDITELGGFLTQAYIDAAKFEGMASLDGTTLDSRRQELANKEGEMQQRLEMQNSLDQQRQDERERFTAIVDEHEMVFGVLAQVRQIIRDKFGGENTFLQVGTSMESQIVNKLTSLKTADKGIAHGYNAFFKLLAQLVSKAGEVHTDQRIIDNILSVVDRIEDNLEQSLARERAAENQRAGDYEQLAAKMSGVITDLQSAMNDLSQVIFTLEARVQSSAERVQNANDAVADYTDRLADRGAECDAAQGVWENFYNNIVAELSTSSKIMYILTDKHALLARYGL